MNEHRQLEAVALTAAAGVRLTESIDSHMIEWSAVQFQALAERYRRDRKPELLEDMTAAAAHWDFAFGKNPSALVRSANRIAQGAFRAAIGAACNPDESGEQVAEDEA